MRHFERFSSNVKMNSKLENKRFVINVEFNAFFVGLGARLFFCLPCRDNKSSTVVLGR